jgi:hypothetical protein
MTLTPTACPEVLGLGAVRVALTQCLERVEFAGQPLRVNAWLGDAWSPPCALIGATRVTFRDETQQGLTTINVPVRLVIPVPSLRPAQLDLEAIVDAWYGALQGDTTLGGVVRRVLAVEAVPLTVLRGNQELPAYECDTRCVL